MAASGSVKIVLGWLPSIAITKVSKSQINEGIVSLNNNAAPKMIICLWWLVSRSGAKGISNLFVGVKRHNITKSFVIYDGLTIGPKEIRYSTNWLIYLNVIKKQDLLSACSSSTPTLFVHHWTLSIYSVLNRSHYCNPSSRMEYFQLHHKTVS
jgi:hypothetical protein